MYWRGAKKKVRAKSKPLNTDFFRCSDPVFFTSRQEGCRLSSPTQNPCFMIGFTATGLYQAICIALYHTDNN
jgi:hypothetical protein